ncbi:helix-turn-helix domain-containing protein [Streptomyces jumonjinensis]|uniref:Helix-turn-helix transcriptional regulator n=1 Tax=Streptomyces jumonjinensis TaxID=1945 RepID=A0A646KQ78_STRJU|nr:helix-turn-helix transcriptional regulator [Streptomyces jumonjinensis]MQT04393.1 helix-turn-helix transcriptional regulator [Streptomyces jumonjinensis]
MLDQLGLDPAAESVYRELLASPDSGVAALATRLALSEHEVREALTKLSELALVRVSTEDSTRMHAVSPHIGMEILLARQQAEIAAQQQRIETSRVAAARLISEFTHYRRDTAEAGVQYLTGLESIRDYLLALNDKVQEEFLTFAPGGPQTPTNMRASRPLNQRLLERGVRMRTIYLCSIRNDPATLVHAEWLTERGAQVRVAPSLPNRMISGDRRVAIIAADNDDTSVGAVVLSTAGMISTLCTLFDSLWKHAEPLRGVPPQQKAGLTAQQAEALRLLAEGRTDESIARSLGVSTRTARRIANTLMAHLHARSRFQAGVHAVGYGYLPPMPD